MGTARCKKSLASADSELFNGLHTIGGKAGRGDGDAGHASSGIGRKHLVCRGLEPFGPPEARLEGDVDGSAELFGDQPSSLLAT